MSYSDYKKYQEAIKNLKKSLLPYSDFARSIRLSTSLPRTTSSEKLRASFLPYSEFVRQAESFRKRQKSLTGFAKLGRQISREVSFYKNILQSFPDYSSSYEKLARQFQVSGKVYNNSIRSLYDRLTHLAQYSAPLSLGEAYERIRREFEEIKGQHPDVIEFAENTIQETDTKVKKAPKGFLSAEYYITLIFSLILFVTSQYTANLSEKRVSGQIQHLEEVIATLPSTLMPQNDDSTYYVVVRFVNLRDKPTTKNSKVLEVLYPNLKVRLVERKGKWILVEYYDHVHDSYSRGWVFKKYLKILNPKRQ